LHQVTEVAKVLIDSSKNKYIRKDLEKSRTFLFLSNNKGRGDHMTFTYRYRKQIIIALFSVLLLGIGGCFLYFSLGEEKVEELIKEMKGEDGDMLGCVEMVWEEGVSKGREEGRKEGRKSIISSMLKNGMSLKEIQTITKATKKEIEEAK